MYPQRGMGKGGPCGCRQCSFPPTSFPFPLSNAHAVTAATPLTHSLHLSLGHQPQAGRLAAIPASTAAAAAATS